MADTDGIFRLIKAAAGLEARKYPRDIKRKWAMPKSSGSIMMLPPSAARPKAAIEASTATAVPPKNAAENRVRCRCFLLSF